jgi:hypothetical protein
MEARRAEIAVLADTTGSASLLLKSDQAMLRKMRHADEDVVVIKRAGGKNGVVRNGHRGGT